MYVGFNPRYVAYALSRGLTPGEAIEMDKGNGLHGFMAFISKQRRAFVEAHPEHCLRDTVIDQDAFTKFIAERVNGK